MTPCTSCCVRTYSTEKRAGRTRNRSSKIARVAPTSKQRLTNKYVAFADVLNAMRLHATRMMSCRKSGHVCILSFAVNSVAGQDLAKTD